MQRRRHAVRGKRTRFRFAATDDTFDWEFNSYTVFYPSASISRFIIATASGPAELWYSTLPGLSSERRLL